MSTLSIHSRPNACFCVYYKCLFAIFIIKTIIFVVERYRLIKDLLAKVFDMPWLIRIDLTLLDAAVNFKPLCSFRREFKAIILVSLSLRAFVLSR